MEKRISYSQFQQVKSAAKMIDPNMRKIESLKNKILPLVEEMKQYQALNDSLEAGIVSVIGFHVSDLVKKVIEPTGAVGKDGKPIKVTKYLPTDIVSYDEQKKEYVIHIPSTEEINAQVDTNLAVEQNQEPAFRQSEAEPEATVETEGEAVSELASEPTNEQEAEAGDLPWNN